MQTNTKQLIEIIVQAIRDEPYFSKEVLIPKIRAIITGFRLQLSTNNYNAIKTPSQVNKLIRSNELQNLEKVFWQTELKKAVGANNIQQYYDKLDEQRLIWDNVNHFVEVNNKVESKTKN